MRFWTLVVGTLLLRMPALAQVAEFGVSVGQSRFPAKLIGGVPGAGPFGADVNATLDNGFRLAFHATWNTARWYGHEFGYAYNRSQLGQLSQEAGMAIHQGIYDFLLYGRSEGKRIRPFAAGGGNFSTFTIPDIKILQGTGNGVTKLGFNFGGGVKVRLSRRFLIRFDYREYYCDTPKYLGSNQINRSALLRQQALSAGFSFVL